MSLLLIKRRDLKVDGWTYGDWRQYVAFLPDDTAVCCRSSELPGTLAVVGFILLSLAAMGVLMFFMAGVPVYWWRIGFFALLGTILLVPWVIAWFTPWRLMVTVSGKMTRDADGGYMRDI